MMVTASSGGTHSPGGYPHRPTRQRADVFPRCKPGKAVKRTFGLEVTKTGGRSLVVQRTGWDKSLVCWTATRVLRDRGAGPTIVISPRCSLRCASRSRPQRSSACGRQPSIPRMSRTGPRSRGARGRRGRRPDHFTRTAVKPAVHRECLARARWDRAVRRR
jgi:hypothetical protein